jgi:hypothetical protein
VCINNYNYTLLTNPLFLLVVMVFVVVVVVCVCVCVVALFFIITLYYILSSEREQIQCITYYLYHMTLSARLAVWLLCIVSAQAVTNCNQCGAANCTLVPFEIDDPCYQGPHSQINTLKNVVCNLFKMYQMPTH